ncbi:hypothetical protein [Lactococcus garvieae]|uniref:hypothetical protein n=1 Tax=Lactococcus garvieae TaxID=1363 RepID=UPI0018D95906|nr:hypothetical protein [Lactococcus garvieae]QPS70945.1 hypothetical protein I6G50_09540 [Lactococcus garvieae]
MKRIKISIFFIFVFGLIGIFSTNVSANSKLVNNVKLVVSNNGQPVYNTLFTARSLEPAYNKIKTGEITDEDMNSVAWKNLESGNVDISKKFNIGKGNVHSHSETIDILEDLVKEGGNGIALINSFNEPVPSYAFHWPGNSSRRFTNNQGIAEANIPRGLVGIFSSSSNTSLLKIVNVTNDTKEINLDKVNSSDIIHGEITNFTNENQFNNRQYVVEYGQEIVYKLTLKKEFLTASTTIDIHPQSNLIIDSISIPYTKNSIFSEQPTPQSFGVTPNTSFSNEAMLSQMTQDIQTNLYNGTTDRYNIPIIDNQTDITIEIKAHIDPNVKFSTKVYGISANIPESQVDITIGGENIHPNTSFFMNITANNGEQSVDYAMPVVRTSGANFVTVKSSEKKLVSGYSYFLGYKDNEKNYIYSDTGWKQVEGSLTDLNNSQYRVFSGGKIYYLGSGFSMDIPLTSNLFSFNEEENILANQSLIKFIGLGQGRKYFLYSTNSPKDSLNVKEEIPFEVSSTDYLTPSGNLSTRSTIGFAKSQDFNINNQIPDYSAGNIEYQAISVDGSKKSDASRRIITFVIISILLIGTFGVILVRLGDKNDEKYY